MYNMAVFLSQGKRCSEKTGIFGGDDAHFPSEMWVKKNFIIV